MKVNLVQHELQGAGALIITPTYNERDNIVAFLEALFAVWPRVHVLVVDDASADGTGAVVAERARRDQRVFVLHRPRKLGIGSAYLAGFRWALAREYAYIFEMDADLSHQPQHLPAMLARLQTDADLVVGSRNMAGGQVQGWGLGRHVLSKGGSVYSRWVLALKVRDLTSGYKGFRRELLRTLDLDRVVSEGYSFQIEVTYRALQQGYRVAEVPIVFVDRRAGKSKMSRAIFVEAVINVWRLRYRAWRGIL